MKFLLGAFAVLALFSGFQVLIACIAFAIFYILWKSDAATDGDTEATLSHALSDPQRNRITIGILLFFALVSIQIAQIPSPARAGGDATAATTQSQESAQVLRVIDGDSIIVRINNSIREVRYIGVDTPEIVPPLQKFQCFGEAAAEFNRSLLLGKTVTLEKEFSEQDELKRLLRHVFIDGQLVSRALLEKGFARVLTIEPDHLRAFEFSSLESRARAEHQGIWQDKCSANPRISRK